MSRKINDVLWDPLEVEERVREREEYLASLFVPIIPELQHKPLKWLVQDLVPHGYLCLLAAEPKEGKTSLATALAIAVASGTPFAGRKTDQGGVLWISAEESTQERRLLLDQSPLVESSLPLYTCYQDLPIDDEKSLDALRHWVFQTEAKLIVVDPLQAAVSGRSLEGGWNARRSLQGLKRFCDLHGIAALVLHHRKDAKNGLARSRAAEHDQLSATAALVMSMKVRRLATIAQRSLVEAIVDHQSPPHPTSPPHSPSTNHPSPTTIHQPRLIALECAGRGDFANQTVWLLSRGPLDYVSVQEPPLDGPEIQIGYLESQILEAIEKSPMDSVRLMEKIHAHRPGTVRNALTRLRRKGLVSVRVWKDGIRHYGLTDQGKEEVKAKRSGCENGENCEMDSKTE